MRIITIISGILFVLNGLWCIINQGVTFTALAFVVGLVMLLVGLIQGVGYFSMKDKESSMTWSFEESINTLILGAIVLSDQLVTDLVVVMFFGMWLLFTGSNRLVAAWVYKKQEHQGWSWLFALAAISVLAGVYSFFNVTLKGLPMGMLVGMFFMLQGINTLSLGIIMPGNKKMLKR